MSKDDLVTPNPWQALRRYTPARIALGRSGGSLPTAAKLEFQLAHAAARDAVHSALELKDLREQLEPLGSPILNVTSAAPNRESYLLRPDLGRRLAEEDEEKLEAYPDKGFDLVFVLADGLSATAVQRHAAPLLSLLLPRLEGWTLAPLVVVMQGRVAVGDPIGLALGAAHAVVLIGERPGLSAPDSLGVYVTREPRPGRNDAERNCISNVRPGGLGYAEAAAQLHALLTAARCYGVTGVELGRRERLGLT
ncbi:ethanolamine ammonia-lyase subunit EutC [soil metagenome]